MLVERYEQLRAAALSGGGDSLGLALLRTAGMAAWIAAWRGLQPAAAPRPGAPGPVGLAPAGVLHEAVVAVLASMAAACTPGR